MSQENSLTSFCKELLTVAGLSVLATVSVPFQAFSLTTEIADIENKKVVATELQNNSFTSFLSSEASELLLAKKDDDDDDDDDDDKKYRYRYEKKDDDYKYHKGKNRSSKYHRQKDWDCYFTVGRYNNPNKKSLVLYLDILKKPETRYANVVYQVYANKKGKWQQVYTSTGARLIQKYGNRYRLEPEIVEFKKLKIKEKDFDKTDLKFVAQIRYDYANRRDERLLIEDTWNYNYITEYTNISQVTDVRYTNAIERENYSSGYFRRDVDYRRDDRSYGRRDDDDDKKRRVEKYKHKGKKRYSYKAYKNKDWDCVFKLGKLVKNNKKAFVVHMDFLNKPVTKYADVVYYVYARQNNRWVAVHRIDGKRSIKKKGNRYYINPEVIEFSRLRLNNTTLSRSDLKFVSEISYETEIRRTQKLVVENTLNYSSIGEIDTIDEIEVEDI